MRYAVISDLHIGDERFKKNEADFPEFLLHLERTHDEIILLGDIIDSFYPILPWRMAHYYLFLLRKHARITRQFVKHKYTMLTGNHDIAATRHWNLPHSASRSADGVKIYFTHGHELDALSSKYPHASEFYMWLAFNLKRIGLPYLYDLAMHFDYSNNVQDGGQLYQKIAREMTSYNKYNIVVIAHTHNEKYVVFENGGIYMNSGDCMNRKMYISLDTAKREYSINYWENGHVERSITNPTREKVVDV